MKKFIPFKTIIFILVIVIVLVVAMIFATGRQSSSSTASQQQTQSSVTNQTITLHNGEVGKTIVTSDGWKITLVSVRFADGSVTKDQAGLTSDDQILVCHIVAVNVSAVGNDSTLSGENDFKFYDVNDPTESANGFGVYPADQSAIVQYFNADIGRQVEGDVMFVVPKSASTHTFILGHISDSTSNLPFTPSDLNGADHQTWTWEFTVG